MNHRTDQVTFSILVGIGVGEKCVLENGQVVRAVHNDSRRGTLRFVAQSLTRYTPVALFEQVALYKQGPHNGDDVNKYLKFGIILRHTVPYSEPGI